MPGQGLGRRAAPSLCVSPASRCNEGMQPQVFVSWWRRCVQLRGTAPKAHRAPMKLAVPSPAVIHAQAGLIIVHTNTGRTAQMVAKYRPSVPIIALVVPRLTSVAGIHWDLFGRSLARQCLVQSGETARGSDSQTHGAVVIQEGAC
jgi:Pyruvate kinase, alpha/beta domain